MARKKFDLGVDEARSTSPPKKKKNLFDNPLEQTRSGRQKVSMISRERQWLVLPDDVTVKALFEHRRSSRITRQQSHGDYCYRISQKQDAAQDDPAKRQSGFCEADRCMRTVDCAAKDPAIAHATGVGLTVPSS